jgi:hypothetical protein
MPPTWNDGIMEYWGEKRKKLFLIVKIPLNPPEVWRDNPSFHRSTIPVFQ